MRSLIKMALSPKTYLWVDVLLIEETKKAILIEFDYKKAWIPKTWIVKIKHNCRCEERSDDAISIKISEFHWSKKF